MIAPSPDWITGFHQLNVCDEENGEWVDSMKGELIGYDAGTDDGKSYESPDNASPRRRPIEKLTGPPVNGVPFGTYVIEQI
mmetsp:Transcript_7580/g.22993  ORF Transcript_7580/g.22993 Transcript_7580/m.22993 type:complete len:81 (-) Transcript_7580:282-524(-)|eukprot:CAMPEP_0198727338 /NCGR_PEP_ID=MMETSP1475-20131203/4102_1 /TAXON_ID= ORGANISM="Unidentified sp., Strain CCMP1999" /NCGR_SAMPLE_ID=MMETSP1475 /ASSEMBLY_ACC=CAM_ASM_001111 /LENGTH=80 /DNA_ID=CAMNT_0044489367 /DNA_START=348 /DNA_END=590 /DNA_ORIENTATION=+